MQVNNNNKKSKIKEEIALLPNANQMSTNEINISMAKYKQNIFRGAFGARNTTIGFIKDTGRRAYCVD